MNTTEALTIACAIVPQRVAIAFDGNRLTYQGLQERVNRLANALAALGVGRGDRVATLEVNRPELVDIYFAAAHLDAIYVPLGFRAKAEELAYMLNDARPAVVFAGERYQDLVTSAASSIIPNQGLFVLGASSQEGWDSYERLIESAVPDPLQFPQGDDSDTTVLIYTAGTTGTPKGVMLTHESLTSYLLANVPSPDPEVEESNLLPLPLYHIGGFQSAIAAVYGGRTLLLMRQFDPREWLELVQRQRPSRSMLVPTMLKELMDHPDFRRYDLSSLKVLTYGAAPMPLEVIRRAIEEFPGVQFINAFGQTESAATITMLTPEDHILRGSHEEVEKKQRRLTSIGQPLEDVEIRLVDEEGQEVPRGQVGEIVARGSRIMKGYWNREGETEDTIKGGWLHTGDLAYQDEDGYIYLSGRAKDFIKRGGEMVSPEEVERVLTSHTGVEDAAIIGVPDAYWGERVRAVVVRSRQDVSEEELMEYCRQRLSSFKKPESVVFVEELPRSPLGKVLKRELRERFGEPVEAED